MRRAATGPSSPFRDAERGFRVEGLFRMGLGGGDARPPQATGRLAKVVAGERYAPAELGGFRDLGPEIDAPARLVA